MNQLELKLLKKDFSGKEGEGINSILQVKSDQSDFFQHSIADIREEMAFLDLQQRRNQKKI